MCPTMFQALFKAQGYYKSLSSWEVHLEGDVKVEADITTYEPASNKWYWGA